MELGIQNRTLSMSEDMESSTFGISSGDAPHIMRILRDTLYSDRILAVVREYGSNAWDAHQESGQAAKPIKVELPDLFNPHFKVRDYGTGLSEEDVFFLYTQYGKSTKRHSNQSVGGFGIGNKSGFAYSSSFTVTSWFQGTKSIFSAVLDETDVGRMCKMHSEPCGDETGIEISIPVRKADFGAFKEAAFQTFSFFDPIPEGVQHLCSPVQWLTPDCGYHHWSKEVKAGWTTRKESAPMILMGCVAYPAPESLKNYGPIVLRVPVGSFAIAANRETLKLDASDTQRLNVILMDAVKKGQEALKSKQNLLTYEDGCLLTNLNPSFAEETQEKIKVALQKVCVNHTDSYYRSGLGYIFRPGNQIHVFGNGYGPDRIRNTVSSSYFRASIRCPYELKEAVEKVFTAEGLDVSTFPITYYDDSHKPYVKAAVAPVPRPPRAKTRPLELWKLNLDTLEWESLGKAPQQRQASNVRTYRASALENWAEQMRGFKALGLIKFPVEFDQITVTKFTEGVRASFAESGSGSYSFPEWCPTVAGSQKEAFIFNILSEVNKVDARDFPGFSLDQVTFIWEGWGNPELEKELKNKTPFLTFREVLGHPLTKAYESGLFNGPITLRTLCYRMDYSCLDLAGIISSYFRQKGIPMEVGSYSFNRMESLLSIPIPGFNWHPNRTERELVSFLIRKAHLLGSKPESSDPEYHI